MQVSRDQLVEDSVFILQCLRQNARGGRQNGLDEMRSTLEGSVALDLAAYVAFLKRFGYVEMDAQSLRVTAQGERAAKGDTDVSGHVLDHFRQVLEQGDESDSAAFEELIRDARPQAPLGDEVVAIASPDLAPVEGELGQVHYRAPEVSASEPTSPQGDAFALGALLHEMLAGTPCGVLPRDLPADLPALLEGLRSADPERRPPLAIAAALLTRLLAPHPLFAL